MKSKAPRQQSLRAESERDMRIGIIGAMEEEITRLKEKIQDKSSRKQAGMTFYEGTLGDVQVVLVRCGIGKVNAAICAQILCSCFDISHLINVGVAGALSEELKIGDIVISTDLIEHDFDVQSFGHRKGHIPGMETSVFSADPLLGQIAFAASEAMGEEIRTIRGRIVSGDVFVCSQAMREDLVRYFEAIATEMEGAAIAHTAYLNQVPFVVIRAMSDQANGEAPKNFDHFVQLCALRASDLIEAMLVRLGGNQ